VLLLAAFECGIAQANGTGGAKNCTRLKAAREPGLRELFAFERATKQASRTNLLTLSPARSVFSPQQDTRALRASQKVVNNTMVPVIIGPNARVELILKLVVSWPGPAPARSVEHGDGAIRGAKKRGAIGTGLWRTS
jgi:hypothetical protein